MSFSSDDFCQFPVRNNRNPFQSHGTPRANGDRMSDKKYKWASPAEWLLDQIENEWTPEQVQQCARELAAKLDGDTIQDIYQSDMSNDGYFDALCPHGHILEYADCEQCGEVEESEAL